MKATTCFAALATDRRLDDGLLALPAGFRRPAYTMAETTTLLHPGSSGDHRDGHVDGNPERFAQREFGRDPGRDRPGGIMSPPQFGSVVQAGSSNVATSVRERRSGGSRRRGEHVRRFHGLRRHRPDHHGIARRRQRAGCARHRERRLRLFRHFRVTHCRPQSLLGRVGCSSGTFESIRRATGLVLKIDNDGISVARATVTANEGDAADYLTMGYWMHIAGDLSEFSFTGVEIDGTGSLRHLPDGPELSA